MAGRKRKTFALTGTETPAEALNTHEPRNDLKICPAKLRRAIGCDNGGTSAEMERSQYFCNNNNSQRRLGGDFFNQRCTRLAKALLGKVRLSFNIIS